MSAAPRLTAATRRILAERRAEAEQRASAGGHVLAWESTFTTINSAGTISRAQDGWCSRCGRLRAVVYAEPENAEESCFRFSRPEDPCRPR